MTELLTAAQMRAIEQAAIDSGEVTGLELMERAGKGVVQAILEEWPVMATAPQKAVVLCGPGNNGGDGFVVARLLKERGWEVEVFLYGDEEKLPPDAKVNCLRWREMGEVALLSSLSSHHVSTSPLVIDALFGTGLTRPVSIDVAGALFIVGACKIVTVDIQSGIDADSGRLLDQDWYPNIYPALTVSFERAKLGHYLSKCTRKCRKLVVHPIGLDLIAKKYTLDAHAEVCQLVERSRIPISKKIQLDLKKQTANNKYSHGHALILSGPSGKTGAARLAARGALRIGAGVVTVACPPEALAENAAQLSAIMLTRVADATALQAVLQDERINALCLGPAFGLTDDKAELVRAALESKRNVVLDADALTLLSRDAKLFGMLHENCVLTPHGGEFARLFPDIAAELAEPATTGPAYSKVDATRDAAKRAGCVVLYKGADTVIADASGRAAINSAHYERSAPWLATAGSGDVLAGFITGLLARGFPPMQAAETAAWLHVECALKFGPGLIAEDIAEQLPKVFADLGL